jgi:hypothetical protein
MGDCALCLPHTITEQLGADPSAEVRFLAADTGQQPPYDGCRHRICSSLISYTWAPINPTSYISVNDGLFKIRENCKFAVQQLADLEFKGWFWIDALRISQQDLDEKSH